ncbi:MAG: recombinase family protein [Nanoarchaeota archaeon]|nr:recombinase family protein [Nanoarchaeota archaeon]
MKRVAIYCRVSTGDQTLDQQRVPLVEMCKKEGWCYQVFEEKVSGAKASRTELDKIMQAIRNWEFNTVLVAKLDRLGRSLVHLIQIIEEWNHKNIQFICLNPSVDTKTSQGMFFLQIMGAVAQLERSMIRERTKAKLDYLRKKGVRLGRPPDSKDKKKRCKSGYYTKWSQKKAPLGMG